MSSSRSKVNSEFRCSEALSVTEDIQNAFDENGYVIIRGLLRPEEVARLRAAVEDERGVTSAVFHRDDNEGKKATLTLWRHPGDDITGRIARSEKVAGTMEKLLGGEVYHYHSKLIMKNAHTGGAFVWHQDYGYWYMNGCMYPSMGTVWTAIDKTNAENGSLKILVGSHKLGRIDHKAVGGQIGADLERVKWAQKFCPLIQTELEPGDTLFFHCNILHRSEQNNSAMRRWALVMAYNRADNDPVYEHYLPNYTPLHKVPNTAILSCEDDLNLEGKAIWSAKEAPKYEQH